MSISTYLSARPGISFISRGTPTTALYRKTVCAGPLTMTLLTGLFKQIISKEEEDEKTLSQEVEGNEETLNI